MLSLGVRALKRARNSSTRTHCPIPYGIPTDRSRAACTTTCSASSSSTICQRTWSTSSWSCSGRNHCEYFWRGFARQGLLISKLFVVWFVRKEKYRWDWRFFSTTRQNGGHLRMIIRKHFSLECRRLIRRNSSSTVRPWTGNCTSRIISWAWGHICWMSPFRIYQRPGRICRGLLILKWPTVMFN